MKRGRKRLVSAVQLPDDIIVEILSRLPVKTLLQFKCVCKSWKETISNPKFDLSPTGRDRAIVGYAPYTASHRGMQQLYFYSIEDNLSIVKLPDPVGDVLRCYYYRHSTFHLYGTCNGLVLFRAETGMYLWNPMTGSCRRVNQLNVLADRIRPATYRGYSGLCYDRATDDYKVVLLMDSSHPGGSAYAFVVSLRTGEIWIDISFPYKVAGLYSYPSISKQTGVLVGGHLHWIVGSESGTSSLIVYFDEVVNQFRELPMPEEDESPTHYFGLTLLDGCLCMSKNDHLASSNSYNGRDILIMREYGMKASWTKRFTVDGIVVPLRSKIPNEIVLVPGGDRHMCRYHLEKKYLRRIKWPQAELRQKLRKKFEMEAGHKVSVTMIQVGSPFMFTESLASVDLI